jgi:ABC-type glycerol-3-phosphate transport system permease component
MGYRAIRIVRAVVIYAILTIFALIMLFPFLVMLFTSLKTPADTFSYPPRLFPVEQVTAAVAGFDRPLPLYHVVIKNWRIIKKKN